MAEPEDSGRKPSSVGDGFPPGADVVISAATGYGPRELRPFLCSLAKHAPEAHVALIVDGPSPADRSALIRFNPNAVLVPVPDADWRAVLWSKAPRKGWKALRGRRWFRSVAPAIVRRLPGIRTSALLHIALARYFFARDLLRGAFRKASLVLLADSRDVFFQADPFLHPSRGLVTGLEDPPISECPHNRAWVNDLYGERGFADLGRERIICSGTTLGPRADVVRYLDAMCEEIDRRLGVCAYQPCYDQGIHNFLLRSGRVRGAVLSENGERLVATLQHTPMGRLSFSEASGLLAADGGRVAIVHQYDRKPQLVRWVERQWGPGPP